MTAKRDFLTLRDLSAAELWGLLERARILKARREAGRPDDPVLRGKSIALLFDKASTRTRVSFEVGIHELGGYPLPVSGRDTQMGRGESVEDTARVLSGYVQAMVVRTYGQQIVEALARAGSVPVINALTDKAHPCQVLADLMSIVERRAVDLDGLRGLALAWVGDGNNVASSWIEAAGLLGLELRVATPEGYEPDPEVVEWAASRAGARVRLMRDPGEAVRGADVISTDVWASMGQEEDARTRRLALAGYQVSEALLRQAGPEVVFLHCLPAHRGEEVTAEVIDGPSSLVIPQAHNRLHTQKALLELLLTPSSPSAG